MIKPDICFFLYHYDRSYCWFCDGIGVILLLLVVVLVILALLPLLLYCRWRKNIICESDNNNVYSWLILILSLSQVIIVGKELMYSQFYVLISWLICCDYDYSEMMMIEKPETDQVYMWHLHVTRRWWPVCCSVQSVSVQPVLDLRSKLPEYMTPADARKEAEVIKQQVCMYSVNVQIYTTSI